LDGGPVPNTALLTVGSGYTFEQAVGDRTFWGRLVESAVGAHLFNTATPDIRITFLSIFTQERNMSS